MIILSDAHSLTVITHIISVKKAFEKVITQDAETSDYSKAIDFDTHKRRMIMMRVYKAHTETQDET